MEVKIGSVQIKNSTGVKIVDYSHNHPGAAEMRLTKEFWRQNNFPCNMDETSVSGVSSDTTIADILCHLANNISSSQFKELRLRYNLCLSPNDSCKSETVWDLFEHMRNQGRIRGNDLIFLQALLWKCALKPLFIEVSNNVEKIKKTHGLTIRYLCSPNRQPVEGFKYINLHVRADITEVTYGLLEKFRLELLTILILPPDQVLLAGIEPADSIWLTFQIPDKVYDTLWDDIEKTEVKIRFALLGVDYIHLEQTSPKNIHVEDEEEMKTSTEIEQAELVTSPAKKSCNDIDVDYCAPGEPNTREDHSAETEPSQEMNRSPKTSKSLNGIRGSRKRRQDGSAAKNACHAERCLSRQNKAHHDCPQCTFCH